tara:strand:+ start:26277 stop:26735 length:459 start_codon:yes stop_codon:yes gene_type:complete
MTLPAQNKAYSFYTALVSKANPAEFQIDPTIAAGDFKVSIDGGALANLATLPVADPIGSFAVKVELSAAEMNGAKINIVAIDAAGAQWEQLLAFIDVPVGSSEDVYNIEVGDHVETNTRLIINEKGTTTPLIDKQITGSLLTPSVTIGTTDT